MVVLVLVKIRFNMKILKVFVLFNIFYIGSNLYFSNTVITWCLVSHSITQNLLEQFNWNFHFHRFKISAVFITLSLSSTVSSSWMLTIQAFGEGMWKRSYSWMGCYVGWVEECGGKAWGRCVVGTHGYICSQLSTIIVLAGGGFKHGMGWRRAARPQAEAER